MRTERNVSILYRKLDLNTRVRYTTGWTVVGRHVRRTELLFYYIFFFLRSSKKFLKKTYINVWIGRANEIVDMCESKWSVLSNFQDFSNISCMASWFKKCLYHNSSSFDKLNTYIYKSDDDEIARNEKYNTREIISEISVKIKTGLVISEFCDCKRTTLFLYTERIR